MLNLDDLFGGWASDDGSRPPKNGQENPMTTHRHRLSDSVCTNVESRPRQERGQAPDLAIPDFAIPGLAIRMWCSRERGA